MTSVKIGKLSVTGDAEVTVEKISDVTVGTAVKVGQVITYTIRVTNSGDYDLSALTVNDDLTGESWNITSLVKGKTETFTTTYTVKASDIADQTHSIVNIATVTGKDPANDDPDTNDIEYEKECEVPTITPEPSMLVEKISDVDADTEVVLGQVINYTIRVTNTGNVSVTGGTVTDQLTGDEWQIGTIHEGEHADFTTEYTVKPEDILKGSVTNIAVVSGSKDITGADVPTPEPGEVTNKTDSRSLKLIIHYRDRNGNVMAPDHYSEHQVGDRDYFVVSPGINGYTASIGIVMILSPMYENIEVTVIYTQDNIIIPEPQPGRDPEHGPDADPEPQPEEYGEIVPDGNGGYTITVIPEEKVPEGILEGIHKDCLIPFLFMLLALLTQWWYVNRRKKYQKEIYELKAELLGGELE